MKVTHQFSNLFTPSSEVVRIVRSISYVLPVFVSQVPIEISQLSSSASWNIFHNLGRRPAVQVFLASGELVIADVLVDTTNVYITFSNAQSGFVILT